MPVELKHPGVYIEEVPSGVRPIVGVSTSVTAFVGRALKGPSEPTLISSMPEFERVYGGLWAESRMSFAVSQFFENGGGSAVIVRVGRTMATAGANFAATGSPLRLNAASPGVWGNRLTVALAPETAPGATGFSLVARHLDTGAEESFRNLSVRPADTRFVGAILLEQSRLLRVPPATVQPLPTGNPSATAPPPPPPASPPTLQGGNDGVAIQDADVAAALTLLDRVDFNLLCLPPLSETADVGAATFRAAAVYCERRRAFLIIDPPSGANQPSAARTFQGQINQRSANAALYFPRILAPNPLRENQVEEFAPCGAIAGTYARTDAQRGVWKAPAGLEAGLRGTAGATITLTDAENGTLNPEGIDAVRNMGAAGTVLWGARTLDGADVFASQWKYIPVRRTALFIEESLFRGTQWVVFEPNDEPLWAQIRLNLWAFMNRLFRQGAFQGTTPARAYFVKCDKETTTQDDIDRGVVNILVGFAPLKPAEFVVIRIQQISGQPPA